MIGTQPSSDRDTCWILWLPFPEKVRALRRSTSGTRYGAIARALVLHELVTQCLGKPPPRGALTHLCPRCGIGPHGRPTLLGEDLQLSVASCAAGAVGAATLRGSVGVDVEDANLCSAGSRDLAEYLEVAHGTDPLRQWVRLEALAKVSGVGLDEAARTKRDETARHVAIVRAGPSREMLVGIATLGARRPRLDVRRAASERLLPLLHDSGAYGRARDGATSVILAAEGRWAQREL